jgi:uncharacterized repeat protein (TIGR01451 family)
MFRSAHAVLRYSLLVSLCTLFLGCGTMRLPAIDPTGERFFLPDPSYTTIVSPYDSTSRFSCLPEPAFTEPPPIPPCTGPGAIPGQPAGTGVAPQPPQARLLLMPAKIIAPINSEVILLAGICGPDGFYITKQPVEWMLSPDSVGNIIGLADSAHPHFAKLAHHSSKKECNNLAITRTTTAAQMITRGTAQSNDDVWVGKGQTWISVSSPTEGVSHVTALANGTENWDFRRQTSTIHWVDMQWAFPGPQIVRAGQPCALSTAVTRSSSGGAATGVFVRYDIIDGTPATFFGEGRTSLELQTNENGRADVQVVQSQPGPGVTRVRVQILSVDLRASGTDRAVIGEGFTTITWSAPGLTISVAGPGTVARGSVATYRVDVTNPGDIATRDVQVQLELPPALKYLNSQPAAEMFGPRIVWRLGELGPKQVVRLDINTQADRSGETRLTVRGVSPDAAEAVGRADTRIVESAISIRFVDPPQTAAVGQAVGFNFEVVNIGSSVLQNVQVRDVFDAGLKPNYNVDPTQPLELPPFSLNPGETKQQSVSFAIQRAGQLCHTLEVTADGGHSASAKTCIAVTQPVLSVDIRKTGPEQARVGDNVPFAIIVTNTGDGVLTNVRIADTPDQNLRPVQGSANLQVVNNSVVWTVGTIGPNQSVKLDLICVCERETPSAVNSVLVTADGGVRQTASASVAIGPALAPATPPSTPAPRPPQTPAQPPANNVAPPVTNVTGEFKVTVVQAGSGIAMGQTGTFFVFLRNERNVEDGNLIVTLQLPDGLEYVKHTWTSELSLLSPASNRRTIEIGPIKSVGALQTNLRPIEVTLRGTKVGQHEVKVQVRSDRLQQPATASVQTAVSQQ